MTSYPCNKYEQITLSYRLSVNYVSRYAPPCLLVNLLFASHLTFVYTLIIGLLLTWLPQKSMIIIFEFPNGKNVDRKMD